MQATRHSGSRSTISTHSVRPYSLRRHQSSKKDAIVRTTIVAYFLSISQLFFAYWLDSSYKGFALVDLLGWWVAAWTLYYLARRLGADHLSALIAAVLLAASPLLISHMWRNAVHVVHSASLVPCFLVALLLLADQRLALGWRVVGLASVLYVASLTYQYQWIIVPCLLSLAVVERRRWAWLLSIVAAAVLFVGMTFFTYQTLGLVGLSVSSQSNDPLAVVNSLLAVAMEGDVPELGRSLVRAINRILDQIVSPIHSIS